MEPAITFAHLGGMWLRRTQAAQAMLSHTRAEHGREPVGRPISNTLESWVWKVTMTTVWAIYWAAPSYFALVFAAASTCPCSCSLGRQVARKLMWHPERGQSELAFVRRRVEGAVRHVNGVDEKFIRTAHDVVPSGCRWVRPIWMTGLVGRLRKMWCSRPTRVGGLHHQRSQPQFAPFTSGKWTAAPSHRSPRDWLNLSSKWSRVCSILYILCKNVS